MTIERHKRVIWRLREMPPEYGGNTYSLKQLRLAIMEEIGTDDRTMDRVISRLQELEMVKKVSGERWLIRGEYAVSR